MEDVIKKAKEIREKYNPNDLAVFPYKNIESSFEDLNIFTGDLNDDDILGAISYKSDSNVFNIYINTVKSKKRQYFTIAHELGHYFLHKEDLKREKILVDPESLLDGNRVFFSLSSEDLNRLEIEADNFAINLIAPEESIKKAWGVLKNPEKCADFFNIPLSLMSAKLEKIGLIGK